MLPAPMSFASAADNSNLAHCCEDTAAELSGDRPCSEAKQAEREETRATRKKATGHRLYRAAVRCSLLPSLSSAASCAVPAQISLAPPMRRTAGALGATDQSSIAGGADQHGDVQGLLDSGRHSETGEGGGEWGNNDCLSQRAATSSRDKPLRPNRGSRARERKRTSNVDTREEQNTADDRYRHGAHDDGIYLAKEAR